MKLILVAVAILYSAAIVNAACGFGSVSLSGMTKSGSDYTGKDAEYTYKLNVCGLTTDAACGQAMCQYDGSGAKVAGLGKYDGTETWNYLDASKPAAGVKVGFTNGDSCWMGTPQTRIVNVEFPCAGSDAQTFTITESPKCTFTISIPTTKSCPGGGGGGSGSSGGISGGTVFLIILLVVIPLYVGIGCVYKRKKLGTSGNESCPNYDFWKEIPGYVRDGFRFTIGGCKRGGTYNQL